MAVLASPVVELAIGERRFDITHRAVVMGILNRTSDSFCDQGSYFAFDPPFLKREGEPNCSSRVIQRRRAPLVVLLVP